MKNLNIYLNFDGTAEEAFDLYKSVFGGEFLHISRFNEMPPQDGMPPMPEEHGNRIMHLHYELPNGISLMASDTMPGIHNLQLGNNTYLSINAESTDEADRIFNTLSQGGEVEMPLEKTFWNAYFGMFKDKYGVQWMVNYDFPQA